MKKTMILFTLIIALFVAACGYSETEVPEAQEIYAPVAEPVVEEVVHEPVEEVDGLQLLEEYLGVSFTINPVELTFTDYRWQFLELHDELNLDNFPGVFGAHMISVLVSDTREGDVLIVTCPDGYQWLHINRGSPWFYVSELDVMVELEPTESLSWAELVRQERFERERERENQEIVALGITFQYSSENIDWYSTDENSQWLPDLAVGVEAYWDRLMEVFDSPDQRIIVYLLDLDDMISIGFSSEWADMLERYHWGVYPGFPTINSSTFVSGPRGRTEISQNLIKLTVHEIVHIFQVNTGTLENINSFRNTGIIYPMWNWEGLANFIAGNVDHELHRVRTAVRNGNFFSIDEVCNMILNAMTGDENALGNGLSKLIFEFIEADFGMEYVAALHSNPNDFQCIFGFSREEFEAQWHQWLRENYG